MKFFRVFCAVIILFCGLFTVFIGKDKISEKINVEEQKEYREVISLWHIDTFEGGFGSRKQFLLDASVGFEKQNQGVLIMVTSMSKESAKNSFENGIYPDIVSSGIGLNIPAENELSSAPSQIGGMVGNKVYATPWCRGNYFLIAKNQAELNKSEIDSITVSQNGSNLPLLSLLFSGVKVKNVKSLEPLKAYADFIGAKNGVMLGTQRDVIRLNARGYSFYSKPLEKYNDLYQYLYVTSASVSKSVYAEKFIKYLTCEEVQKKLFKIGLMSPFYSVESDIDTLVDAQKLSEFSTVSAFILPEKIAQASELSHSAIKGDISAENKLKNLIVTP